MNVKIYYFLYVLFLNACKQGGTVVVVKGEPEMGASNGTSPPCPTNPPATNPSGNYPSPNPCVTPTPQPYYQPQK